MPLHAVTLSLHSLARGRRQPLESKSDKDYKEAFTELGRLWEVSEELSEKNCKNPPTLQALKSTSTL